MSLLPFFATLLLSVPPQADAPQAALRMPALIAKGMVLQRDDVVPLWGHGRPGAWVELRTTWGEHPMRALVEADGTWRLRLATPPAGGPHSLEFRMDEEQRVVDDVWSGEVWLASGQSNMEWKIAWIADSLPDYAAQVKAAYYPKIHVFDVPNRISMSPESECEGRWRAITPEYWPDVSAVGFYFAKELQQALDVPVGLISSEWGGTVAESWTGEAKLRERFPEFAPELDEIARLRAGQGDSPTLAQLQERWWSQAATRDLGSRENWQRTDLADGDWKEMSLPTMWENAGLAHDGFVWFRRSFEIPANLAGRELALELGAIDDMDTVWLDGRRVGGLEHAEAWQTPRHYAVPAALATAGRHVLAIRALDTGGPGGFSGPREALALKDTGNGGAPAVPLAGSWRYHAGAAMGDLGDFPRGSWFHQNRPTALFNGMIAPLVGYGLRGAIWYQGESNRAGWKQYETLFPAMIQCWRGLWNRGDFPFLFVQIAPYRYGGDTGETALLRDAQRKTLALPNTGMAVTMDIGDPGNIHPTNKAEVGRRLALWARARVYGEPNLVVSGPLYRSITIEGNKARVAFDFAEGGLSAHGGAPSHLQVAGADHVFRPAQGTIDGETLIVWSPEVSAPEAVRYAFGDADEPNLFNQAGLPASSFRTDDWEK